MASRRTVYALEPGDLPPGTEVGAWRVLELCGKGTYGAVYRAEPVGEKGAGPFALKLALRPVDPRFWREVELLSRIHHPNVPHLEDRGLWAHRMGPFPFIVMEWVEGVMLYDWADQHEPSWRQVMRSLAQVARALQATHGVEGVHRDVKGANVLVRPGDGKAMLLDFGAGDFRGAKTLTWEVLPPGTPQYRSPEARNYEWLHWREKGARYEPGPADDVYALGVTAYRLVTGSYPPNVLEPKDAVGDAPVPDPLQPVATACPELVECIRKMLSEEPSARSSTVEVAEALERAAETAGPQADLRIPRRRAQADAVRPSALRSSRSSGARRLGLTVTAGIAATLGLYAGWRTWRQPVETPVEHVAQRVRDGHGEAAGTTGLAKDSLTLGPRGKASAPAGKALALEMTKKPLPGQARPPCKGREIAINGGCWIRPEESSPPCTEREYEWKGVCYYPVLGPPPPPATSAPR